MPHTAKMTSIVMASMDMIKDPTCKMAISKSSFLLVIRVVRPAFNSLPWALSIATFNTKKNTRAKYKYRRILQPTIAGPLSAFGAIMGHWATYTHDKGQLAALHCSLASWCMLGC